MLLGIERKGVTVAIAERTLWCYKALAIMLQEEKFHADILCRTVFIAEDLLDEVAV